MGEPSEGSSDAPAARRGGWLGAGAALLAVLVGGLYLLNLFGGRDELLPDHAVLWGNLDEAAAAVLFLGGCRYLFPARSSSR